MITLYKYLFYSYSYVIRKYDNLWGVGDTYFVGGGMLMAWMIVTTTIIITESIRFIIPEFPISIVSSYLGYFTLALGIAICIYLGLGRRCDRVYKEIVTMKKAKKKIFKILNIIHLIVINGGYFVVGEYARHLNGFSSILFD